MTEDEKECRDYLENFWTPKVGSKVEKDGSFKKIAYIEDSHPEQVILESDEHFTYLQDCSWFPEFDELDKILLKIGFKVMPDSIQLKKIFLKKPTSWKDYADSIRQARLTLYMDGIELFDKLFR